VDKGLWCKSEGLNQGAKNTPPTRDTEKILHNAGMLLPVESSHIAHKELVSGCYRLVLDATPWVLKKVTGQLIENDGVKMPSSIEFLRGPPLSF
jgi:hypothetical protein